ncbi:MAG: SAM-dependent methyltransferase [Gammaproteobacteria bacterium]
MVVSPDPIPGPGPEARARSDALAARIRDEIASSPEGSIPFSRFMERALYEPGLGYYSGGAAKFGPAGDFVTAPEVSPLFGRCVGRQIAEVLSALGGGGVLELGAGTGSLARAALDELADMGRMPEWTILEPSPELRQRQAAGLAGRVAWADRLPAGFRGVILANEVADALPVDRFLVDGGDVRELAVGLEEGRLAWRSRPANPALEMQVREVLDPPAWPDGYTSEVRPALGAWIGELANALHQGLILLADYGLPRREYYAPQRSDGTLICHYRHRAHGDPFLWPGLQDITAWVDFTRVAEAGTDAGLTLEGFTPQSAFLAGTGLPAMVAGEEDPNRRARVANEARQLTLPGEMGERFRVMGLSRGLAPPLSGFGQVDLARRL